MVFETTAFNRPATPPGDLGGFGAVCAKDVKHLPSLSRQLKGMIVSARIRLVKVVVQPVFVLDDGENITEVEHQPTVIPANEWPTYSSVRFPREVEAWQVQLDGESSASEE
jgi:hypothetical protein